MKSLKVLYTNADQLVNKRDDLSMHIAGDEPDIIMISEVIPKAQTIPLSLALLSIPGYNLYISFDPTQTNLGRSGSRGICIYTKEYLASAEVSLYKGTVIEQLWISLRLANEDKLLVGCVYLSPSGNRQHGMTELEAMLKAVSNFNPSHILMAGDFNVPQIDWSSIHSPESPGHFSHSLIEITHDNYLTRHVTNPTRYRVGQTPSIGAFLVTSRLVYIGELWARSHRRGASHNVWGRAAGSWLV